VQGVYWFGDRSICRKNNAIQYLYACLLELGSNGSSLVHFRLAGGKAKETQLLVAPHYPPDEDDEDGLDMGALMSGRD
jgi:hypothetical protein